MSNRNNLFSRIRLVYRRSSPLLKCAVLAAIVLATVAILTIHLFIRQNQQTLQHLQSQAARVEQENQIINQQIDEIGTVQSIKRIASEELGLVDPEAEFFYPAESNP